MLRRIKRTFTPAEYLAMEEVADYKSEYFKGEIFAISGGTPDHSTIAVNIAGELNRLLASKPCRVFNSDMRLHIERNGLYTYPDVMVICGKVELAKKRKDTVTNPLLIIEVLSESTRDYRSGNEIQLIQADTDLAGIPGRRVGKSSRRMLPARRR